MMIMTHMWCSQCYARYYEGSEGYQYFQCTQCNIELDGNWVDTDDEE